jgi:hypothetical protein
MSMDLSPKKPNKAYDSDGGAYYDWSPADLPMLGTASIGAAKLCLSAGGLALPSYSDSAKVAYVLQGKYLHILFLFLILLIYKSISDPYIYMSYVCVAS